MSLVIRSQPTALIVRPSLTPLVVSKAHLLNKEKWAQHIAQAFSPIPKIDCPAKKAHAAVEWIETFFSGVDHFEKMNQPENWAQLRDRATIFCDHYDLKRCTWLGQVFQLYNTPKEARIRLLTNNYQKEAPSSEQPVWRNK